MMKSVLIGWAIFLFTFSAWAGTFIETFDGGELEEWQELIRNDAAPGSWEIVNGELQAVSPDGWTRLLTIGDETWQDYDIEFDVKPQKKHDPGNIAIAARIKGTSLVFWVIGDRPFPESNATCLGGNFHENRTQLFYIEPHPFLKLDEWSTLKLSVKGKAGIFWINGKKIMETGDPFILRLGGQKIRGTAGELFEFLSGGAGFGLTNYTARFDNIVITGDGIPDKGVLSVTPRAKLATTWGSLKRL